MSIVCPIYQQAQQDPQALALVWDGGALSYGALHDLVCEVQRRLEAAGIGPADRVALALPNTWRYVVLMQALFRLKGIAVPISIRFAAQTVRELVDFTGCKVLVDDGASTVADVPVLRLKDLVPAEAMHYSEKDPMLHLDQPATILFSSGSTGNPKAILHSWGNHYYNALGSNENIEVLPADRWLLSLPLFHVAGQAILFRCFIAGATVVLPASAGNMQDTLQQQDITHVSLVSTQLLRLLDALPEGAHLPAIKHILLGGSAIPRSLIQRAHARGWPIHTSYGMTEMASQVTTTAPGASCAALFTSGRRLPYRDVRIDADRQILVKGKTRFVGLVTGPREELHNVFDDAGWYATGDLGYWDAGHRLVVLGRKDNMFISGGENIYPEEIERALEQLETIWRAVVVPVPDDEFGFRPVAFVDQKGGGVDVEMLETHLEGRLPGFMRPVAYLSLDMAGSKGMKISRKALMRRAATQVRL